MQKLEEKVLKKSWKNLTARLVRPADLARCRLSPHCKQTQHVESPQRSPKCARIQPEN